MSGCLANQPGSVRFQRMHSSCNGLRSFLTVRENGQPERVIETPCQPRSRATTASAARQCEAWLSPTSAIVARAERRRTPNSQTFIGLVAVIVQGAFGRLR